MLRDPTEAPLVEAVDLCVDRGDRQVVKGFSLQLLAGQLVALRGENGAGKTTLLRVIAGLTRPVSGFVKVLGVDLKEDRERLRRDVAFISHSGGLILDAPVSNTLRQWRVLHHCRSRDDFDHWAQRLGISKLLDKHPIQLSAGQQRRCALAQMMVRRARVWLLDEPMAALDARTRGVVEEMIEQLREEQCAVLASSHDAWPEASIDNRIQAVVMTAPVQGVAQPSGV